jgi:L-ribulose-5-phosphate 3-epimerase
MQTVRRDFLKFAGLAVTGLAATSLPASAATKLPVSKGILTPMLPKELSWLQKFQLAKEVGFQEVEVPTVYDSKEAEMIAKASSDAKMPIHSIMNADHWKYPLNSPDASVRQKCKDGMKTSLDNAKLFGASTVLLVPAVVNDKLPYNQAWEVSTREIKTMIPWAEERKIVIGIEEVWNKFLYSPREFAAYVDQFQSPWIKAYFDVGNCLIFGYPQDWIRTLGNRIQKVHLKDFKFAQDPTNKRRYADFVNLRDGQLDWKAVHQALLDINYKGSLTVELEGGDKTYLTDLSQRVDAIIAGA